MRRSFGLLPFWSLVRILPVVSHTFHTKSVNPGDPDGHREASLGAVETLALSTVWNGQKAALRSKLKRRCRLAVNVLWVYLRVVVVPLVEFVHSVFTGGPGESYRRSSLLCLRYVFRALINSLVTVLM